MRKMRLPSGTAASGKPQPALQAAFFLAVLLAGLIPAGAQHAEVQELASRLAEQIGRSGKKIVVVADFAGPEESFTELGRYLALELTASLAWAGKGLDVFHAPHLPNILQGQRLSPKEQSEPQVIRQVGQLAGGQVVVFGSLELTEKGVRLSLKALDVADGRTISEAAGSLPKTPTVEELLAKRHLRLMARPTLPVAPAPGGCASFGSDVRTAGRDGVTQPQCISCPSPEYSEEARTKKVSATVLLLLAVTPDGRGEKARIIRGAGYGLDEKAIEAVQKWRFTPARGPDGKPVAVCVTAEVSFRTQ